MGAKSPQQKAKKGPKNTPPKKERRAARQRRAEESKKLRGAERIDFDRMITGTPITPVVVGFVPTGRALIGGRWVEARELPEGRIEYRLRGELVVAHYGAMLAPL